MDIDTIKKELERAQQARSEADDQIKKYNAELQLAKKNLRIATSLMEDQRTELDAILNNVHSAIFLVDETGLILRTNRSAELMFNAAQDELWQTSIRQIILLPEEQYHEFSGDDQLNQTIEALGKKKDCDPIPVEVSVAPVTIRKKEYSVWICNDISQRKEDEYKRVALERELAQAQKLESLGILASGVAHEINTPVQYVMDNNRFIREGIGDLSSLIGIYRSFVKTIEDREELKTLVEDIAQKEEEHDTDFILEELPEAIEHSLSGLEQIAKIVSATKSFAHPGDEEKTLNSINDAIETTIAVARNQWKYVAELTTDLDPKAPPVRCIAGEINQVLLNLIVNATQAIQMKKAEGLGRIKLSTRSSDDHLEIAVEDNGCGIDPKDMNKIFDPFFTTKDVGDGTGQGLSLCYNIVTNKHGGSITCESKPNNGTTFRVRLPLSEKSNGVQAA